MALSNGAKKFGKLLIGVAVITGLYTVGTAKGWIPGKETLMQVMGKKVVLSDAAPLKNVTNVPLLPFPSNKVIGTGPEVRANVMGWQSQNGLGYANGGGQTTEGSIMANNGVTNFKIIREDNCNNQVNNLIAYGQAWDKAGRGTANPSKGVHAVSFMLDGSPSYMAALKAGLAPYNLTPKIVTSFGISAGEDSVWGSEAVLKDAKKLRGAVMIGVMYDGDNNIGIKKAYDNDVAVNPDPKTYDKNKLNLIPADDYLKAVDMAIAGVTETRQEVVNGVKTGKTIQITTDASKGKAVGGPTVVEMLVATWTPGDVRLAEGTNLVPIASTVDNYWQMPEAFIVIKEWADANKPLVKKIIKSGLEGGAQVKVHDKALYKSCELAAKYYATDASPAQEKQAKYWYDNYRRREITNKDGQKVTVGGSANFSIEDNIVAFGLDKGDGGPAASSYTAFGDKMAELWPQQMSAYPAWQEAFDDTFIKEIVGETTINPELEMKPKYDKATVSQTVSSSAKPIQFDSGRATVTSVGRGQLNKLYNDINITGLYVTIIGHTDTAGDPQENMKLSEARALAVKNYLVSKGMPENRFRVEFYGESQPLPGANDEQNRRVVIEFNK